MGVEDLTFSDRKNLYEGVEEDQSEIKDSKEMEATSSPVIEDIYKSGKTSPKGKGKSTMFFRGWKSIGKKLGFKKIDKFIDSTGKASEESNKQYIDSTVSKEVNGDQDKKPVTRKSATKDVNSVDVEEDVFEEEIVKEITPKVIKEPAKIMTEIKESPDVRENFIAKVAEEQGIDSIISQEGKEKKEIPTPSATKEVESIADQIKECEEERVKETAHKVTNEQDKIMPEIKDNTEVQVESNPKENVKTAEKDIDSVKAKPDIKENIVTEEADLGKTVTKESHDVIEKEVIKDFNEQAGEKEAETTMLMSLVDNINSTRSYLESDESQNSYDDPKKSTTQEAFFTLIDLLEDKKSAKSSSEKTQTFSTWAVKDNKKGQSQIRTVNDVLKKMERVTSSKTEHKLREKSSKNSQYRDQEDRKLIKKFEEMNVKSEDLKKVDKKESIVQSSADVDQLTDTISSLRLSSKDKADKKKTRDKKKVRYLERGPDKGKVERRQQVTSSVAPYTSRPTVSVNWGNLSGGQCVPGRESSADSLPRTIRNDDSYYSNNARPTAMVDGRSFVQYDAPNVQQNIVTFPQQNIATFPQQNIAPFPQQDIEPFVQLNVATFPQRNTASFPQQNIEPFPQQSTAFVKQDFAVPTHLERENNWEDIELTIQDRILFSEPDENTDVLYEMLKLATPCSPDCSYGMNGESTPCQYPSLENSPLSQTGSSPTQFNLSPNIDRVGTDWSLPISSPEWVNPNRFPENSPISEGSPGSFYSSSDWNQRNGDSSCFSSLESPPVSGNDDCLLNKKALGSDLNPMFTAIQPNSVIISDTNVDGNFGQNQLYTLPSEVSVNIDPLISSDAVRSIQQIRNELESSHINEAKSCQHCPYDTRNATDVLCEEFGNLDRNDQRNILSNVHRYDETKVMLCFDSLLLAYEKPNPVNQTPNPSSLLPSMYSVCERLLMTASTRTKFFQTNEEGQTPLDRAVLNCPQMPILSRYLAECCIRALPNPPSDKDCTIDRNDADRNGLLHRAVSKGEPCIPHLAGLLDFNMQNGIFDVNQKNADGYSPLHLALMACSSPASASGGPAVCRGVCLKLSHLLLQHGNADPNIKAHKNGNTPLHVAVDTKACASNLVSLLLQYKAIISSTNYSKLTPMDLAKQVSKSSRTEVSREVVKIMKDYIRRQRINNNNNRM